MPDAVVVLGAGSAMGFPMARNIARAGIRGESLEPDSVQGRAAERRRR